MADCDFDDGPSGSKRIVLYVPLLEPDIHHQGFDKIKDHIEINSF